MKTGEAFAVSATAAVLLFVALLTAGRAFDLPVVYRDAATGECRSVHSMSHGYSCAQMPDRYDVIYVGPPGGNSE